MLSGVNSSDIWELFLNSVGVGTTLLYGQPSIDKDSGDVSLEPGSRSAGNLGLFQYLSNVTTNSNVAELLNATTLKSSAQTA